MARPIKNNADYFPHDADMRNDPKVKAIRRKFGIEGYGIYCMTIEYLSDSDFFVAEIGVLGIELMAGDFDIDPKKLKEVIDYCISIDLFQVDNYELSCKSLDNRLESLLSKRKRDRIGVIDDDNTQSKGKESKGNERKEKKSKGEELVPFDELFIRAFDEITCERLQMTFKNIPDLGRELQMFRTKCDNAPDDYHRRDVAGLRLAFQYQLKNYKNGKSTKSPADKLAEVDRIVKARFGNEGTK